MLILLRDTDTDGRPIFGSGLLIEGEGAVGIVEKMQATSPFNVGEMTTYMRHVLSTADDEETALSDSLEETAREFLERLARYGLIKFMKDGSGEEDRPLQFEEALNVLCNSGLTNMLDYPVVARLARELGYEPTAEWIEANPTEYAAFLLGGGFRPLRDNFGGGEEKPCADKQG